MNTTTRHYQNYDREARRAVALGCKRHGKDLWRANAVQLTTAEYERYVDLHPFTCFAEWQGLVKRIDNNSRALADTGARRALRGLSVFFYRPDFSNTAFKRHTLISSVGVLIERIAWLIEAEVKAGRDKKKAALYADLHIYQTEMDRYKEAKITIH